MTNSPINPEELADALRAVVTAWEALPGGQHYGPAQIAFWLQDDMRPAIDKARAALSPHRWVGPTPLVKWPHCSQCGIIKRADGRNKKLCKGPPKVGPRSTKSVVQKEGTKTVDHVGETPDQLKGAGPSASQFTRKEGLSK